MREQAKKCIAVKRLETRVSLSTLVRDTSRLPRLSEFWGSERCWEELLWTEFYGLAVEHLNALHHTGQTSSWKPWPIEHETISLLRDKGLLGYFAAQTRSSKDVTGSAMRWEAVSHARNSSTVFFSCFYFALIRVFPTKVPPVQLCCDGNEQALFGTRM